MARRLKNAVAEWLRHEVAGREAAAERALEGVFRRLPAVQPPADFALRVLAEAGIAAPAAPRWAWRAVIAVCLALGALSTTLIPWLATAVGSALPSGKLTELGIGLVAGTVRLVAQGLTVWETLSNIAAALASAVSSPAMLAAAAAAALVSFGAFGLLRGLMDVERGTFYVKS